MCVCVCVCVREDECVCDGVFQVHTSLSLYPPVLTVEH